MRRWQCMTAFDPAFSAESFQIQPDRTRHAPGHGFNVVRRDSTTEKLDDHVGNLCGVESTFLVAPMSDHDALDFLRLAIACSFRANPLKTVEIIDPQGDGDTIFPLQLPRQPPANTDVTIVIDYFAEQGECGGLRCGCGRARRMHGGMIQEYRRPEAGRACRKRRSRMWCKIRWLVSLLQNFCELFNSRHLKVLRLLPKSYVSGLSAAIGIRVSTISPPWRTRFIMMGETG